jgi:hypothetical protein
MGCGFLPDHLLPRQRDVAAPLRARSVRDRADVLSRVSAL